MDRATKATSISEIKGRFDKMTSVVFLDFKGMTVEQVKAAKPTMDFDGRYGSTTGSWTTDMFVEAVYRSLNN